ncbi:MAG: family 16 glycoside hydrolase [Planctomycetota bacterium]
MRRIALLLLLVVPVNADPDTALFFAKKARDAAAQEDYDKAEHWCQRALEEEEDFAPALLALADIAQARGNRAQALKHLEACIAQEKESLSDEERLAVRKARLQLKKLEPARFAFERLADEYVRKVLALARREAKKNPELARECWRNVLLVDPTNAEATGKLGPAGETQREGTLLLNGKDLDGWTGSEPAWTVRNGHLFGRVADAANINRHKREIRGKYSLVCELRVREDIGDDPLFGIVFGVRSSYDHFGLWIWPESWRLEHQTGEHERSELARRTFRSHKVKYSRFDWNTYRIDVDDKRITSFVNGKKVWSTSGAIRSLDGCVGCWVQEQAVEIRKFQLIER